MGFHIYDARQHPLVDHDIIEHHALTDALTLTTDGRLEHLPLLGFKVTGKDFIQHREGFFRGDFGQETQSPQVDTQHRN